MTGPKKSLGQHWLHDRSILARIANEAELTDSDTVLEIGPGLGTLTSELLRRSKKVVAVEFDEALARKLPGQFPGKNLEVVRRDILTFDLSQLPKGYKVVANVPYYITSKIVQHVMTAKNKPAVVVLLVQKEVAERLAAKPGEMSILAISAQIFAKVSMGMLVPAALFTPVPKVDSAVVILKTHSTPLVKADEEPSFFRIVKIGFAAPRKKLYSNLAGGLGITKDDAKAILVACHITPNARAQDLSVDDWLRLVQTIVAHP
ncbi:MAG TPA: 16S rRNA (adenine(1518)-N(6)/adenine(1519)-N(6))-dimethyltransferase RsmA [Candidatus Saccharimonadales bacterium]|nr:16S rRNA (adenine(1518)-N(6)/adenine(1519)-N(6))-dimethyltransferase RsmA [Candidatus Saccharimonadales bacterium]